MNENTFKGAWKDFKGEIINTWGKLTHDDLEQTKGNMTSIGGLIQQKYGHAKDEVSQKLNDMAARFSDGAKQKVNDVTAGAAKKTETAKDQLRNTTRQ